MDKRFKKESRELAERKIQETRTGNPIADSITANKFWNEHLRRITS